MFLRLCAWQTETDKTRRADREWAQKRWWWWVGGGLGCGQRGARLQLFKPNPITWCDILLGAIGEFAAVVTCEAETLQTNSLYKSAARCQCRVFQSFLANNRLLSLTNWRESLFWDYFWDNPFPLLWLRLDVFLFVTDSLKYLKIH